MKNITALLAEAIQLIVLYGFYSVHIYTNSEDIGTSDILYIENSKQDT